MRIQYGDDKTLLFGNKLKPIISQQTVGPELQQSQSRGEPLKK